MNVQTVKQQFKEHTYFPMFGFFYPSDSILFENKNQKNRALTRWMKYSSFFLFYFPSATFIITIICKWEYFFFRFLNGLKLYSQHLKQFLSLVKDIWGSFLPLFYECVTLTLEFSKHFFYLSFYCVTKHECIVTTAIFFSLLLSFFPLYIKHIKSVELDLFPWKRE